MYKKIIGLLILVCFSFGVFAVPQVTLDKTVFGMGPLNLSGFGTSGSKINLYANDNFVGSKTLIASAVEYNLSNGVSEISVPVGSDLIFRNDGTTQLHIKLTGAETILSSGSEDFILNPGTTSALSFEGLGSISYSEVSVGLGSSAIINIVETQVQFSFENIEMDFLKNGNNAIKVKSNYYSPLYGNSVENLFSISYDKYPVIFTVSNYTNLTRNDSVFISGYFQGSANVDLFYNINSDLRNPGAGIPITNVLGSKFNVTLVNLVEGENVVRVYSVDKNNGFVNGEKKLFITKDTIPPEIKFTSAYVTTSLGNYLLGGLIENDGIYMNENKVTLNLTIPGGKSLLIFNRLTNKSVVYQIVNDSVGVPLTLVKGENPYDLEAFDMAGNSRKVARKMFYSNEKPKLLKAESEPKDFFKGGGTTHFPFQKIKGKVSVPNSKVTVFAIGEEDKEVVTCKTFIDRYDAEKKKIRDNLNANSDETHPEWSATTPSFFDVVKQVKNEIGLIGSFDLLREEDISVDSNGNFETIVGLVEKQLEYEDADTNSNEGRVRSRPQTNQATASNTRNEVCFLIEDPYGNVAAESISVNLDMGNSCWTAREITVTPNTLYSAEITQAGNSPIANDGVEASVFASFTYVCDGEVSSMTGFKVSLDTTKYASTRFASIPAGDTRAMVNPNDKSELLVYFPVRIRKVPPSVSSSPTTYEDGKFWEEANQVDLAFKASITYTVNGVDLLVDTRNPIYFETKINIENPYDHSKWLTPKTIDKAIGYLNKSIKVTEDAVKYSQYGVYGGMAWCTVERLRYAVTTQGKNDNSAAKKNLFTACDRVVCLPTPQRCADDFTNLNDGGNGVLNVNNGEVSQKELFDKGNIRAESEDGTSNTKIAQFEDLNVGDKCDYGVDANGQKIPGVYVSGKVTQYEEESVGIWKQSSETGSQRFNRMCVPAEFDNAGKPTKINVQKASGVCYTADEPRFDSTKCWLPGMGDAPGWDPNDNIIESLRCGCITKTYSHLKNLLKMQKDIRACLESVKLGEVRGSYCERLMAMAVCDIGTNVIFKTLATSPDKDYETGEGREANLFAGSVEGMRQGDKTLNDRYKGTWWSQAGLGSQQLANKVCIGAITGDWSAISDQLLQAVEEDQIEPTFLPAFPESRFMGYDPLTGTISVMYRFTYGVVSGGQSIRTKVSFMCDSSKPGAEFCAQGVYFAKDAGSDIDGKTLVTNKDSSASQTVTITDNGARFRYNILVLEHDYMVDGKKKTRHDEFEIMHKDEVLIAMCDFSGGVLGAGAGINCEKLFSNDALVSMFKLGPKTQITPAGTSGKPTLYVGNPILVNLFYDIRGTDFKGSQDKAKLYYKIECNGAKAFNSFDIPIVRDGTTGNAISSQIVDIYPAKIPNFGTSQAEEYYQATIENYAGGEVTDIYIEITDKNGQIQEIGITEMLVNYEKVFVGDKQATYFNLFPKEAQK